MSERNNVVAWFEIPAANFDRATKFYEDIFATGLDRMEYEGRAMSVFPHESTDVSGCIMQDDSQKAGGGTLVYLNCNGRIDEVAGRVEAAGGKLLSPRIELPNAMGSIFHIADSEGNRVGLHAVA